MLPNYQRLMLQSLREELAFFNMQQFVIVLFITALLTALFVASQHERLEACARVIPIAVIGGLFALGRADLLMHRAGIYARTIEQSLSDQGWESFKMALPATRLLPLYDVFGLSLWLYLLAWAERQAMHQLKGRTRTVYLTATLALVVAGFVSIVIGAVV
jgi:hypothetical protein